jgi:hypothetical protein
VGEGKTSPFGARLRDAACKATIPPQAEMEAVAEIWTEGLLLKPKQGRTLFIPFTETSNIEPANYRVRVITSSSEITLSTLGIKYEPFARSMIDAFGDALEKALLLREPERIYEARANYAHIQGDGQSSGMCRARIYPTAIVILPDNALPFRVPFSSISSVEAENYMLKVMASNGGVTELSRMGNATQYFADKLGAARRDLEGETLETIKGMLPSVRYEELLALNDLMSEGRAALSKDIEAISKELWEMLEAKVNESSLADTYKYISSLGSHDYTAIGLRKVLQDIHVWFLVPVRGSVEGGGNSLVMEVTSETGHATYLFKVMDRMEFPGSTPESFSAMADGTIRVINEGMIATGFRREPIYLSDEKLSTSAYSKYLYAAKNLDALMLLREKFYARIIHSAYENWQKDLNEAMAFNTKAQEEGARWGKSQLDQPED